MTAVLSVLQESSYRRGRNSSASGFTLTELLVVTLIISVLLALTLDIVEVARDKAALTACANQLHQLHVGFENYSQDFLVYPCFEPPYGLGDRCNWMDLWLSSDPTGGSWKFSGSDANGNGVLDGNETSAPRVPRLLAQYTDSLEVLHCSSKGETAYWMDVGPYYYNTTSPFPTGGVYSKWIPRAGLRGENQREPLAACQNPAEAGANGASWRHGEKSFGAAGGINQQMYTSGAVKQFLNPQLWKEP